MKLFGFMAALIAVSLLTVASPASAKPKHSKVVSVPSMSCGMDRGVSLCPGLEQASPMGRRPGTVAVRGWDVADSQSDPRPRAWCAWWLRRHLNIARSAFPPYQYNLARAFAKIGTPAHKGCTKCIAIFSRGKGGHVGIVESWDANGNPVILSGNFNGRVDTAPHPVNRLLALRWVS